MLKDAVVALYELGGGKANRQPGALGMILWSWLAFPGLILGALATGAFSSGRAGAGDKKTAKAARVAAALGICVSLPVILALIVRAAAR